MRIVAHNKEIRDMRNCQASNMALEQIDDVVVIGVKL